MMDCNTITHLLSEIKREADRAKDMLDGGNTGWQFHAALDLIVQHNADIRKELQSIRPRHAV
jgi:hypothetical protein